MFFGGREKEGKEKVKNEKRFPFIFIIFPSRIIP